MLSLCTRSYPRGYVDLVIHILTSKISVISSYPRAPLWAFSGSHVEPLMLAMDVECCSPRFRPLAWTQMTLDRYVFLQHTKSL
jgi:hypothetical protein